MGREQIIHKKKKKKKRKNDWKKFDKNNLAIAFKVLYTKNAKIYPTYVSKHNSMCEKQIILVMISKGEGWH